MAGFANSIKLSSVYLVIIFIILISERVNAQVVGDTLGPWQPGTMEIHHIGTGRGNATFFIFPDGTNLLFDAGEFTTTYQAWRRPRFVEALPDSTKPAGHWLVQYLKRQLVRSSTIHLDYAVISHFHWDHYGQVTASTPYADHGAYKLTGLTTVGHHIPIHQILDRGWDEYAYPGELKQDSTFQNYLSFLSWHSENGNLKPGRFKPGSNDQITIQDPLPSNISFEVRNISANGEVWTGHGTATQNHFPLLEDWPKDEWPTENMSSISLRISLGKFDYYTGGDLRGIPPPGYPAWHDMETPVAKAVGEVDVAVANHHGYLDSQNEFFVSRLQPRIWILPVWDSAHPTGTVFQRIRSQKLYTGERDIFATALHEANKQVVVGLDRVKEHPGHIVVIVSADGSKYQIAVVSNQNISGAVKAVYGPYHSQD